MKVNGKHISLFGAKLVDYSISGTPLTQHTSDITKYGVINKYGTKAANKKIIINLVFKATWFPPLHYNPSMRERLNKIAEQITQFDSELINCDTVTIELPNGYTYLCIPTALGTAADDGSSTHDSSYTFTGIQAISKINRYIPLIMAVLGLLLNIWLNNGSATPEIILAGMISGLSSTGLYESFKQFLKL